MADTRVVLIEGPRQSGKTTLAGKVASSKMPYVTLDDQSTLDAARSDPVGFIRERDRLVVDTDKRPGRFLLTGSTNLMALPQVADSLAGRIEIISLLPLSQSEIRRKRALFLVRALSGVAPGLGASATGTELVDRVVCGGYPEALERRTWARRQKWFLDYIRAIIERDVHDVAQLEHAQLMPRLMQLLAAHSGQLVNYSTVAAPLGIGHMTTQRYVDTLARLFLVRTLQPWYTNAIKRVVKTPKLHFLDSGLLAALRDLSPARIQADRTAFGALLETFVLTELLKLASWHDGRLEFFHFRDRSGKEVDIVIEDSQGGVLGIEVKAAATVSAADFSGLRKLAEACGRRFIAGFVLYDHDVVLPFGERMFAVPISTLWDST
jgi:uncharacterized protein